MDYKGMTYFCNLQIFFKELLQLFRFGLFSSTFGSLIVNLKPRSELLCFSIADAKVATFLLPANFPHTFFHIFFALSFYTPLNALLTNTLQAYVKMRREAQKNALPASDFRSGINNSGRKARAGATVFPNRCRRPPLREHPPECTGWSLWSPP